MNRKMSRSGRLVMLRYAPYLLLRHIWIQSLVLALMFFAGTVIFQHYQRLDWLTALLGSVSTITTIGIYAPNIANMPNDEKILLVIVFIASVGAAASLVQGTLSSVLKKELFVEEMDEIRAKSLKDHVIVMGYSFLGKYVTDKLKDLGLASVVITRDEKQAALARAHGNVALSAPVTHAFEALKRVQVERASAVVVTYDDDGDNMLAVMAAKRLNPAAKVVTIVNDNELGEGARAAQADVVIAPSEIMGRILAVSTVSDEIAGVFTSDRMKERGIAEFEVKTAGVSLEELDRICPVLMITRNGAVLSQVGKQFTLEKGDVVYVLTDHQALLAIRAFINSEKG